MTDKKHTEVLPFNNLAQKQSRALTVIENAAQKRREALLARIKPLQDEIAQLDRILAASEAKPEAEPESEAS